MVLKLGQITRFDCPIDFTDTSGKIAKGIILCAAKNGQLVKYATIGLSRKVFISKYLVKLSGEKELDSITRGRTTLIKGIQVSQRPRNSHPFKGYEVNAACNK
jgi:hypothetical protein